MTDGGGVGRGGVMQCIMKANIRVCGAGAGRYFPPGAPGGTVYSHRLPTHRCEVGFSSIKDAC
jgi:hypothetical protein